MAIDLSYFINGKPAGTPKNAAEIKLISNWSDISLEDKAESEVSTNTIQFALEDATTINDHVLGGLTGQGGIFEGIPYKINYKSLTTGASANILDGYIDLTDEALFISCDEVEARVKKNSNLDWLTEQADSFSFGYLASSGVGIITASDYIDIKCTLNYRPDAFTVMFATTSLTMISLQFYDLIRELLSNAEVPINNYVGFAADFVYAGFMVVLMYNLVDELFNQILPPTKIYKGMYLKTLFEKGCQHLGLTLQSTIFDEQKWKELRYMPAKSLSFDKTTLGKQKQVADKYGHQNANSAIYNFGDFLRVMKQMFNAQIKIEGTKLVFERKDYWDSKASWNLPNVETDQQRRLTTYGYNTDEISANYFISFQTDLLDQNTLDNFQGTNFQAITKPVKPTSQNIINIKGLSEVRLPFALGYKKDGYTTLELALIPVTIGLDALIAFASLFGGSPQPTFSSRILNRDGHLLLSQENTSVDKLFQTQFIDKANTLAGQVATNLLTNLGNVFNGVGNVVSNIIQGTNVSIQDPVSVQAALSVKTLTAEQLWLHYHCINSFDPLMVDFRASMQQNKWVSVNDQAKIYQGVEIPFCEQDWVSLQTNNRFNAPNGNIGEMLRIEWDIQNEKAIVDYKVKELYTKNLTTEYNEGQ